MQTDRGHAVSLDALRVKANPQAAMPPVGVKLKKDKKDKKQKKEKKDRGSKVTGLLLLIHLLAHARSVLCTMWDLENPWWQRPYHFVAYLSFVCTATGSLIGWDVFATSQANCLLLSSHK